jgi:dTDP-4-dehydrorhamnose 3,5-epimerase
LKIHVSRTTLPGVLTVEHEFFRDDRGFFVESYHRERFTECGIGEDFVQDNHSRSERDVLRGFHYQDESAPMGKLVCCTHGEIYDVAVDLRVGSRTFSKHFGIHLTADNMKQIFIPSGFGHAFATLSDAAEVHYKCTGYYEPSSEGTISWDDPDIGVQWPLAHPILSSRDQNGMSLRAYLHNPAFRSRTIPRRHTT